jgi:hypothetical protein
LITTLLLVFILRSLRFRLLELILIPGVVLVGLVL